MSMTAPIRRPDFSGTPPRVTAPGRIATGGRPSRHLVAVAPKERAPKSSARTSARTSASNRRRPKAFFAYVTAGVMFGVMVAQMLLSVATESGAYEIAHLQSANKEATRSYQQMTQEIDRLASPQHLALNAEALGMMSNNTPAYLRLSDGAVLGAPTSGDGFRNLVAGDGGSLVPNSLLADVPIVTTAPSRGTPASSASTGAQPGAPAAPAPTGPVALTNGLPGLSTR